MADFWQSALDVLLLRDYNTRLVVLSVSCLGIASGLIGAFLLLRQRSLIADALSHACLPGIGLMFMLAVFAGADGRSMPLLLLGAALSGMLGVWLVSRIRDTSPVKDDAAMGIVLGVFFGFGVVVMGLIQSLPGASSAGLEKFIYGKAASIVHSDFLMILFASAAVVVATALLFKEWRLLCFDEDFATAQGWPTRSLDLLLMALMTLITVVGLQAVGLILIVAFLILPAAAARFWTDRLFVMVLLAGAMGGLSGWLGSTLSALLPNLPTGALVVLTGAAIFVLSLLVGPAKGFVPRLSQHLRLQRRIGRQHLLRAAYELLEERCEGMDSAPANLPVDVADLREHRSWSPVRVNQLIRAAIREDHVETFDGKTLRLSEAGFGEASRTTRNHRLWERYLIDYADIAPSHVDRDADAVEHILGADMVRRLEAKLGTVGPQAIPRSPHPIRHSEERLS